MIKDSGTEQHCRPLATYENQVYFTAVFVIIFQTKFLLSSDFKPQDILQRYL
jgi:hypothetical protein